MILIFLHHCAAHRSRPLDNSNAKTKGIKRGASERSDELPAQNASHFDLFCLLETCGASGRDVYVPPYVFRWAHVPFVACFTLSWWLRALIAYIQVISEWRIYLLPLSCASIFSLKSWQLFIVVSFGPFYFFLFCVRSPLSLTAKTVLFSLRYSKIHHIKLNKTSTLYQIPTHIHTRKQAPPRTLTISGNHLICDQKF